MNLAQENYSSSAHSSGPIGAQVSMSRSESFFSMIKNCLFPNAHLLSFITLSTKVEVILDGPKDFADLTVRQHSLHSLGSLDQSKIMNEYQYWRLLVPVLLNVSLLQLLVRCIMLIIAWDEQAKLMAVSTVGFYLERFFSPFQVMAIYIVGRQHLYSIGGTLLSVINKEEACVVPFVPVVAMAGAYLGYCIFYYEAHVYLEVPQQLGKYVVIYIIVVQFLIQDNGLYNSTFSCVGGFGSGMLLAILMLENTENRLQQEGGSYDLKDVILYEDIVKTAAAVTLGIYFVLCLISFHSYSSQIPQGGGCTQ